MKFALKAMRWHLTMVVAMMAASACSPSQTDPDNSALASSSRQLASGKIVFQQCTACHSILGDGVGPDLRGVYGRKAGTEPHYSRYSAAMMQSKIVWDYDSLQAFLTQPTARVKGTYMLFPGVRDPSKRADLIVFLKAYK